MEKVPLINGPLHSKVNESNPKPGLGLAMAVVILLGQLIGSGMLALPHMLIGTGPLL